MEKKKISVSKTARYFQAGSISNKTKNIWFVFHGYGMLGEFFIKKFESLVDSETIIIAPEATSRFYLNNKYERVGASWITKVDKDDDIIDNANYLNQLYNNILSQIGCEQINLNILGFSQGGSTACRWALNEKFKINSICFWGSDIPKECLTEKYRNRWSTMKISIIIGKEDTLIPLEYREKFRDLINDYELNYSLVEYDGDHRIIENVLIDYANNI